MVSLDPLNFGRLGVVSKVEIDEMRLVCLRSGEPRIGPNVYVTWHKLSAVELPR